MVYRIYHKILVLLFLLFWVEGGWTSTLEVTDHLGRKVTIQVPVKRAVVVIAYELIPALDIWDSVVGVSRWAVENCGVIKTWMQRDRTKQKTSVGEATDLHLETLYKLKPDVVITWGYYPKLLNFLEQKGIRVIAINPEGLTDLYETIRLFGKIFGREKRAEEVISEMEKMFQFIRERVRDLPSVKRRKVLYLGGTLTRVYGKIGVISDVIQIIGAKNVAEDLPVRYADVSVERIIQWNPDVIYIWGNAKYDESWIYGNSQWQILKAVKKREVYKLPKWSSWSPKLAPLALLMATKTYPELFKDINFESKVDEFYRRVFGVSFREVRNHESF